MGLPRGNTSPFKAAYTKDKAIYTAGRRHLQTLAYDECLKSGKPDLIAFLLAQMTFRGESSGLPPAANDTPMTVFLLGAEDQINHINLQACLLTCNEFPPKKRFSAKPSVISSVMVPCCYDIAIVSYTTSVWSNFGHFVDSGSY